MKTKTFKARETCKIWLKSKTNKEWVPIMARGAHIKMLLEFAENQNLEVFLGTNKLSLINDEILIGPRGGLFDSF